MIALVLASVALIHGVGTNYTFHSPECHAVTLERVNEEVESVFHGWKAHSISTHHKDGSATFYVSIKREEDYADVNVECKGL